jgi:hypothetical protein
MGAGVFELWSKQHLGASEVPICMLPAERWTVNAAELLRLARRTTFEPFDVTVCMPGYITISLLPTCHWTGLDKLSAIGQVVRSAARYLRCGFSEVDS